MEQREKLIDLIIESVNGCARHWAEIIADYLLANGVVVLPCRCGECEYWECGQDTKGEIYKSHLCDVFECGTTAYDFCSYGERKGGDE